MKFYDLDVKIEDKIAYVSFNRPETNNSFNLNLAQELLYLANEFIENDGVEVIVLGAKGDNFSHGLSELNNPLDEDMKHTINLANDAIEAWAKIPFPIITSIQGECNSLALSLACVADIRYAQSNATFSVPEVSNGLVPGGGITQRLPRLIGKGPSMSMLLSSDIISAQTGFEWGLLNKIVDEDKVWEVACSKARELVEMSTLSMQYTKECILRGSELPFEDGLRLELNMYMLLQTGFDRMEGVNAYLEKRTPHFKGK